MQDRSSVILLESMVQPADRCLGGSFQPRGQPVAWQRRSRPWWQKSCDHVANRKWQMHKHFCCLGLNAHFWPTHRTKAGWKWETHQVWLGWECLVHVSGLLGKHRDPKTSTRQISWHGVTQTFETMEAYDSCQVEEETMQSWLVMAHKPQAILS